jgi:hypothetical protein
MSIHRGWRMEASDASYSGVRIVCHWGCCVVMFYLASWGKKAGLMLKDAASLDD